MPDYRQPARTWALIDPPPGDVKQLTDKHGRTWERSGPSGWQMPGFDGWVPWAGMMFHAPLTEFRDGG